LRRPLPLGPPRRRPGRLWCRPRPSADGAGQPRDFPWLPRRPVPGASVFRPRAPGGCSPDERGGGLMSEFGELAAEPGDTPPEEKKKEEPKIELEARI